ncbi:MAG: RES family NAD+ phosphorylase [Gallionella sp.]|nr:RES family NAD+ phosphorylase [Gallionella sp.]
MSLDECDKIFTRVREARSLSEACHALERLFDLYSLLNIELLSKDVYWRARNTEKDPWPCIKNMLYPPPENAELGRLNDKNVPCLYAATRIETALQEINAKEGDLIQLVGLKVKPEAGIRVAVIGEFFHVYKKGYLRLIGVDPGGTIGRLLNSKSPREGMRILYVDAFLSGLLAEANADENEYIHSRSIASMIYREPETDGIMFPSVRDELGMNLALRPIAVNSKMRTVCCIHVKVTRVREFGFIEYDVISEVENILSDDSFSWATPRSSIRRYFNLTKEESETGVRDSNIL